MNSASQNSTNVDSNLPISRHLIKNERILRTIFERCSDVVFRDVTLQGDIRLLLIYVDGMIDKDLIQFTILKPLLCEGIPHGIGPIDSIAQMCEQEMLAVLQTKKVYTFHDVADLILQGSKVAFLANGEDSVTLADVTGFDKRPLKNLLWKQRFGDNGRASPKLCGQPQP